ncbi:hypothetical protein E8Q25_22375 [Salmonella enterica]|nr:hypothetical protein [Salmonella enterica subsp. enterica serovar Bonariensis]EBU3703225.1 hypothetical protein [Salmonella enterica]ECD4708264.1 hypothetical protein [Salmonella enterica subsp. enterica serovar Bonariensis]
MLDDVTKLLSGFLSRMALQGDGSLREPSPRQKVILCTVVSNGIGTHATGAGPHDSAVDKSGYSAGGFVI